MFLSPAVQLPYHLWMFGMEQIAKCARGSFLLAPEHTDVASMLVSGMVPCLGVDKNDPRAHPVSQSDF